MVIEQNLFDKRDFLQMFQKRFFSFCEKSPLFLRFTLLDNSVLVYDLSTDPEADPIEFKFDFSISEKANIKQIKDYLVKNNYPIITTTDQIKRYPTTDEVKNIQRKEKISLTDAMKKQIVECFENKYRLEKVLNYDNSVIIRNLITNELDMYKVKIPLTIFIREIFINPINASDIFIKKCEKIKKVIDKNEE
jgi:hypothetical protein